MPEWLKAVNFSVLDIFSITNLIDIAIVAFVLYRFMLLIKGTRAVQLLKGLAVLVVATAASSLLQLYTLQWILKQAMTALLVALPIVFQPELRRALEKLGGGSFLSRQLNNMGEAELDVLVGEIVRAVRIMAKEKIGALIVLERSTGLEEYIDTGIKVGGRVSGELLVNIFIPRTPLHDGAVIIRGDRIMAAACMLPLTQAQNLSRSLGTRHRAAIGITEESDCLAVIVSEETGTVSLAVEGVLARGLDEKLLADRLTGALRPAKQGNLAAFWLRR
ncbi:MAG: membrane protein [Peptococcaceae bacterium BRH_c4a]|nr:MAG: membrane protein [Peptococcaceae bacterium BRH_c4a]